MSMDIVVEGWRKLSRAMMPLLAVMARIINSLSILSEIYLADV